MATAALLSPATVSLRLKPFITTLRNLSTYHNQITTTTTLNLPPKLTSNFTNSTSHFTKCFSTVSSAVSTDETLETSKNDKIGEFRKRLRIVDIKGGQNDKLGQVLTVKGWVRTLRVQRSVTFIEVNDGSSLEHAVCD